MIDELVTIEDGAIKISRPYAYLGEGIYFDTPEQLQALTERLNELGWELGWRKVGMQPGRKVRMKPQERF